MKLNGRTRSSLMDFKCVRSSTFERGRGLPPAAKRRRAQRFLLAAVPRMFVSPLRLWSITVVTVVRLTTLQANPLLGPLVVLGAVVVAVAAVCVMACNFVKHYCNVVVHG